MNVSHCMIARRTEARALTFAHSIGLWRDHLMRHDQLSGGRLLRRKLGLASGRHTDFLLGIVIKGTATLDDAFTLQPHAGADALQL